MAIAHRKGVGVSTELVKCNQGFCKIVDNTFEDLDTDEDVKLSKLNIAKVYLKGTNDCGRKECGINACEFAANLQT